MPRFAKGSPEAKEWAQKMREARTARTGNTAVAERPRPVKLSPNSVEAGVMQPSGDSSPQGVLIKQISIEEAEADLDELGVDDWVKKHYDHGDFNIQNMANLLRETPEDIYNRLHIMGYELPDGTYSANL
jgi:hypothetical protein